MTSSKLPRVDPLEGAVQLLVGDAVREDRFEAARVERACARPRSRGRAG